MRVSASFGADAVFTRHTGFVNPAFATVTATAPAAATAVTFGIGGWRFGAGCGVDQGLHAAFGGAVVFGARCGTALGARATAALTARCALFALSRRGAIGGGQVDARGARLTRLAVLAAFRAGFVAGFGAAFRTALAAFTTTAATAFLVVTATA